MISKPYVHQAVVLSRCDNKNTFFITKHCIRITSFVNIVVKWINYVYKTSNRAPKRKACCERAYARYENNVQIGIFTIYVIPYCEQE